MSFWFNSLKISNILRLLLKNIFNFICCPGIQLPDRAISSNFRGKGSYTTRGQKLGIWTAPKSKFLAARGIIPPFLIFLCSAKQGNCFLVRIARDDFLKSVA
jgi:hypothetical protein